MHFASGPVCPNTCVLSLPELCWFVMEKPYFPKLNPFNSHGLFFQTPDHLMTGRAKNKDDLRMFLSRHFFDGFDHLPHPKGFLGQCGTHIA